MELIVSSSYRKVELKNDACYREENRRRDSSDSSIPANDGLSMEQRAENALRARLLVYMCGICASMISILLGYDVGIMAEAIIYIDSSMGLTVLQGDVIIGCLNLIAAVGGFAAGKSADSLGRNRAIGLACMVFLLGATIMTFSNSFGVLLIGRLITGLGVGSGFVVGPIYVTEITPKEIRGMMVAFTDVCINVGILLGFAVGIACRNGIPSDDAKWRAMIGIGMVPPFVICCLLCFLPESPRWLALQNRDEEALKVLEAIIGSKSQANDELAMIRKSIEEEEGVTASWSEVFCPKHRHIMIPVALSVSLGLIQQISGTEALIYYSPEILDKAGFPLESDINGYFIVVIGFCKVVGEVITMFIVERFGRKPFFYVSSSGVTFFMLVISLSFAFTNRNGVVVGLFGAMFFFSVGMGALTFAVATELNPLSIRGKTVALTTCVNRFTSGVVALIFNSLVNALGYPGYFLFYTSLSFVTIFFFVYFLPETGGKELEEIAQLFVGADVGSVKQRSLHLAPRRMEQEAFDAEEKEDTDSDVVNVIHNGESTSRNRNMFGLKESVYTLKHNILFFFNFVTDKQSI